MRQPWKAPEKSDASSALTTLRDYIQFQELKTGKKLPPERTLASILKVGRPSLREAIKALSILGILESRRGDGTYIQSLGPLMSGWPSTVEIPERGLNMLELLEMRKMFEPRAAGLAAARASVEDLRNIERTRIAIEEAGSDWNSIGDLDLALHQLIVTSAGNSILSETYGTLRPLLLKSREITTHTAPGEERMKSDHRAIVDALVRREPEGWLSIA